MKKLACRDLGVDCSFVATADTSEEAKMELWEHAELTHPDVTAGISAEEKKALMSKMDQALRRSKVPVM